MLRAYDYCLMRIPARQQLAVFLAATFAISLFLEFYIIKRVGTVNGLWTYALMLVPGLVAIACTLYFNNSGKIEKHDLALWMPNPKYFALAYAVPALAAVAVLLISVVSGIGAFQFTWDKATMNRLVFAPTLGVLVAGIMAAGEELGWRGFMQTKLKEIQLPYPYFFTGIVWALWHWPLILFSDYATSNHPAVSILLFTIMIVSFSFFLGQLREASRSVWPCVLAHSVHNTWIQGIYPHFIKAGALDPFFGGESGVILAILYLSLAIFLERRPID